MEKNLVDRLTEENLDDDNEITASKRERLASSILDFISNKKSENEKDEEDSILASLFERFSQEDSEELLVIAETTDKVELASIVIDQRIEELNEAIENQVPEIGTDISNNQKIIELEKLKEYIVGGNGSGEYSQKLEQPSLETLPKPQEIVQQKKVETTNDKPIRHEEKPAHKSEKAQPIYKTAKPKQTPHKTEIKTNHSLESAQPIELSESEVRFTHNQTTPNIPKPNKPENPKDDSIRETRRMIETIYEKTNRPLEEPRKIEEARPNPQPETIINRFKYLDIAKKISIDNVSLNQFFNRYSIPERTRVKIIGEILRGERPDKAVERELKKKGVFKSLLSSMSDAIGIKEATPARDDKEILSRANLAHLKTKQMKPHYFEKGSALVIIILLFLAILIYLLLR